jgi:hypothetical protein
MAAYVGKVWYDSLRILELREGATEGEVKAAFTEQCPGLTIQTSTTQDSLACLMRKQLNSFNI